MPNPFPVPRYVQPDDELTADAWNELIDAIAAGRIVDVDGAEALWLPDGLRLRVVPDEGQLHYFTTGTITAASHAGSTVSDFVHTQGSGPARLCTRDPATGKLTPCANLPDETIYNDVEASIAAGYLVKCAIVDGVPVIDLKDRCS